MSAVWASAVINVEFIQWDLYRIFRALTNSSNGQYSRRIGSFNLYIYYILYIIYTFWIVYPFTFLPATQENKWYSSMLHNQSYKKILFFYHHDCVCRICWVSIGCVEKKERTNIGKKKKPTTNPWGKLKFFVSFK